MSGSGNRVHDYYWDTGTLQWVPAQQGTGGGTGGGGDASASNQVIGNASLASIDGKITAVNTGAVVVSSSVLPSGAATGTKQDTGNTSLSNIDGHLDVALSTRLKPADTLAAVTTVGTITNPVTVAQATATSLKTQAENYQGGSAVAAGNPLQVTLANTGANATAVKVDGSAVTQPVSGTVAVSGSVAVTGPLTDTQLRASAVPVSNTGLTNIDVALSTRLKAADTLAAVTTVGTITNVVHIDDNAGSLTVDNNGTFAIQAQDGSGNLLTSLTGAPVGTERGLSVRPIQTQRVGVAGNLGVLNGFAEVLVDGYSTVSGRIVPAAFTGQLACQYTLDGTNYSFTTFVRRDTLQRVLLVSFVGSSTAVDFSLTPPAGATKIRFVNVAYTSGTCSATAYASTHMDALLLNANAQPTGTPILLDLPTEVGGPDDSGLMRPIQLRASTPLSTDYGLVSRVIFPTPGDSFSGVSGPLMQAAVSDARESYYDGRIEPLSMTSDGRLRVSSSSSDTTMLLTFADDLTSDVSIWDASNPFF